MATDKGEITLAENATEIVHLAPGDRFAINGLDYAASQVEITGADIIILNPENGGKIIFPGLGLILFDQGQSPSILMNGQLISAKMFGDKIGTVSNVTTNDYVSFTSLNVSEEKPEEPKKQDSQEQDSEEVIEELQEENQQLQQQVQEVTQAQEEAEFLLASLNSENAELQAASLDTDTPPEEEPREFAEVVDGGAPPQEENDFTSNDDSSAVSSSAATETETETSTSDTVATSISTFSFQAFILQPGATETVEAFDFGAGPVADTFVVRGGGGNADATFNPDNTIQLSDEVLNYSTRTDDIAVFADNDALFDDSNLTRSIEVVPSLPDGFELTSATVSGLPAGFEVIDATGGGGSFTLDLTESTETSRGSIQFDLKYPIPNTQSFDIDISVTATFDPASGVSPAPAQTVQTFVLSQSIEQKDVSGPADLNYENPDGSITWVLANSANQNTILSGSGDDYLEGSGGVDVIQGAAGNDIIDGNDGDDTIDAGANDDVITGGLGDDDITGGTGTDTVTYEGRTEDIALDMNVVDGDGYATATVDINGDGSGGESDRIRQVQNITAGDGNDTITGDANDNIIIGGAGDDILDGGTGDDTLDGGDGTDTVSFISGGSGLTVNLGTGGTINVGSGDKTLLNIESITATNFDDTITAVGGDNTLNGADGDDIFITDGDGTDTFDGGFGGTDTSSSDRIDYSTSLNGITLNLSLAPDGDGFHSLTVGATTDRIQNFEIYYGSDNAADIITGSTSEEEIRGNGGDDNLAGGEGDDVIYGGSGSDTIDGGTGGETATGDTLNFSDLAAAVTLNLATPNSGTAVSGADTDSFSNFERYVLTSMDDTINESVGADIVDGGAGTDEISYAGRGGVYIDVDLSTGPSLTVDVRNSGDYSLIETDIIDNIENITGSNGDDNFIDGASNNTIDGGGGSDSLTYENDATAISFDMNFTTGGFFTITQGAETDTIARIENITGSTGDDVMQGNAAVNTFDGFNGNDRFIASGGGDIYTGGAGTDWIRYDSLVGLNSVVANLTTRTATLDLGAAGADASDTIDTYTDDLENISGTSGDDTITGNAGNNVIYDLGGDDVLDGAGGSNEINYSLLSGNSVTVNLNTNSADDDAGAGSDDTLTNFVNIVGSNQGDSLTGDGAANTINGGNGDDSIFGLGANDILNGGNGDDNITGGAGADTIDGGADSDRVFYDTAINVNLSSSLSAGQAANSASDGDTLTSIEAVTTSALDDTITAGSTTVSVNAGSGNDTIISNVQSTSNNIDGGADTTGDIIDYTGTAALSVSSIGGVAYNVTSGGNTDIVTNVERFRFGNAGDTFSIDTSAIGNLDEFDANGGSDEVTVTNGGAGDLTAADIDGDTFAGVFFDIETLDFRSTDLTGGDRFDISGAQVGAITDANDDLTILIDGVNITFGDIDTGGTAFVGGGLTRTADFGGGVTLTVVSDV